ncbi:MAG TPA: hypothetical protein VFO39_02305 [Candidatus Sulfotelmatobacter sp.]|nr:hypothetical protein [Candidatus Sulfotelmatobacter sp.]
MFRFKFSGRFVCAYWYFWPPVPNKAVLAIGVAAVLMTITEMKPLHKAVWIAIVFFLAFVENSAINKDRLDGERAQRDFITEQRDHFRDIGSGVTEAIVESQRQFDATMKRSDNVIGLQLRTLNGLSSNLNTLTGAKSYAFLWFVPGQQYLAFIHQGQYPLYGVEARIVDLDRMKATNDLEGAIVHIGDMIKGHVNIQSPVINPMVADRFNANIFFTARNGDWMELLRVKKSPDGWVRAMRVVGRFTSLRKESVVCENIDNSFSPSELGDDFKAYGGPKPPRCQ